MINNGYSNALMCVSDNKVSVTHGYSNQLMCVADIITV